MQKLVRSFIVSLIFFLKQTLSKETGCYIETFELTEYQPIILNEYFEFLYPENGQEIYIPRNEKLFVSCVDENNFKFSSEKSIVLNITCLSDGKFLLGKKAIYFENLQCKEFPTSTARLTKRKCGKSFQEIEIGFDLGEQFVRVLDICFDPGLQTPIYSHFHLTKWISYAQTVSRVSWLQDFYNLNNQKVDKIYSKKNQKEQINSLLELPSSSNNIVKDDNRHFLARGHLTAKADLYYIHQQRLTFYLINAAPQWQSFNNGNWKILENAVRKLTNTRNLDLEIYTGTYKILEMISQKTESKTKIFLFKEDEKVGLPVPLFFWKIVYDPKTKDGVAFLGVNNPYITRKELPDLQICQSVSEKIKWVEFQDNFDFGYCYACRLTDFLQIVEYAPRLETNTLLE